jgi:hypothetical protein
VTASLHAHVPDTGIRIVSIPGIVRAHIWPAEDAKPEIAHVTLESDMQGEFRFTRCRHDDNLQFTMPGWQAFIAAVKAGELDGLVP